MTQQNPEKPAPKNGRKLALVALLVGVTVAMVWWNWDDWVGAVKGQAPPAQTDPNITPEQRKALERNAIQRAAEQRAAQRAATQAAANAPPVPATQP